MSETEVLEKPPAISTEIVLSGVLTGRNVFAPGGVDRVIASLEAEVRAIKTDATTPAGRDAIKSLAFKVARSKTALDKLGKDLTEEWRKATSAVNAERKIIETRLDALRDEVRKPVDDFEAAEADRIRAHHDALNAISATDFAGDTPTVAELEARLEHLAFYPSREWQEFGAQAKEAIAAETVKARTMLDAAQWREHQAAVEAQRRADEEESQRRLQVEREKRIADEAAAEATRKAEANEAALREEIRVAEERRQAEAAKAEQDREDAAKAAVRREQEAIEAERKRAQEAREVELALAKKREENIAHQRTIHRDMVSDLVKDGAVDDDKAAHRVVKAIALRKIRHVRIDY